MAWFPFGRSTFKFVIYPKKLKAITRPTSRQLQVYRRRIFGINSGSSFRNKTIILELHDSMNCVYNLMETSPLRHSTSCLCGEFHLTCEQSPGGNVHMYEMKIVVPVGTVQKFNFYLPHWRYAEFDLFDLLTDFLIL